MALDKEFLELEFEKAEEVQLDDLKPGDWYIWESNGFGYPPQTTFKFTEFARGHHHGLIHPNKNFGGNSKDLVYSRFPLTAASDRGYYSATRGYSSRLFRAKQQPELGREQHLASIGAFAANIWPTTGSDPEIFAEDAAGNVIPAWEFLPKKDDKRLAQSPTMFWDGFQAEFTVGAGGCQDGVAGGIALRLCDLQLKLPPGARLSNRSVVEIPRGLMTSASSEHVDFGCRPSLNAYGLHGEVIPDPRDLPIRFAGGHIHWGIVAKERPSDFKARAMEAVKFVDLVAGLIGVSISEGMDDPRRRQYYGLAGEYRLPPHGIEYRVLSNSWLTYPAAYHLLFTLGRLAMKLGLNGKRGLFQTVPESAVVQAINRTDVKLARELIEREQDLFRALITQHWPSYVDQTLGWIFKPMTAWGIDTTRIVENWTVKGSSGFCQRWNDFLRDGALKLGPKASQSAPLPNVPGDTGILRPPQSEARA